MSELARYWLLASACMQSRSGPGSCKLRDCMFPKANYIKSRTVRRLGELVDCLLLASGCMQSRCGRGSCKLVDCTFPEANHTRSRSARGPGELAGYLLASGCMQSRSGRGPASFWIACIQKQPICNPEACGDLVNLWITCC